LGRPGLYRGIFAVHIANQSVYRFVARRLQPADRGFHRLPSGSPVITQEGFVGKEAINGSL